MSKYTIAMGGGSTLEIDRHSPTMLSLKLGDKKVNVLTEDLAQIVRQELPNDRGAELFSEIEEKSITKGKARIHLQASKDLKKGDDIWATIDITKYMDSHGRPQGIRTTYSGLIY